MSDYSKFLYGREWLDDLRESKARRSNKPPTREINVRIKVWDPIDHVLRVKGEDQRIIMLPYNRKADCCCKQSHCWANKMRVAIMKRWPEERLLDGSVIGWETVITGCGIMNQHQVFTGFNITPASLPQNDKEIVALVELVLGCKVELI